MSKLLLSIVEAAKIVGIGRDRAYELVRSGEWESVEIGKHKKVPRSFLIAKYSLPTTPTPEATPDER